MLDEIIDYVKFLQLQVKVKGSLSLSLSLLLFILYCGLFNKWEGFPLGLTYYFNVF
jgi:hypothetical protein